MSYIDIKDSIYPEYLRNIHNPPKRLYFKGNIELINNRCLTIVGTRKATQYGQWVVDELITSNLRLLNISVVSGLASGIDSMVHRRCLDLGIPTIAFVGGGIDNVYPLGNRDLFKEIEDKGLLIAEFPGCVDMHKGMFPMRNRLLAGISKDTLVIEADVKSGSNITANFALDFGRNVYVIPGDIDKNTSHGCNMLIKQGAEIITSKDDFLSILGIEQGQLKMSI